MLTDALIDTTPLCPSFGMGMARAALYRITAPRRFFTGRPDEDYTLSEH